ncbi:hypothetical protein CNMCM5793_004389 [Aspergillus hiratsukae]|uniref:Short-chain dehydrogenase n=1 Tax=Aspergillus hiratsukae TaxID=1194566 RepID=A0A8H6PF13_9EURO|nr:hypothetical protein CNMCM5793_004389 [Aspergillus hiratsukae]
MSLTPETLQEAPKRSNPIPNVAGTLAVYIQSAYSSHTQTEKKEIRVVDLATGQSRCITNNPNARSPQRISRSNQLIWLEWLENGNTDLIVGDTECPTEMYKAGTLPGQAFDLEVTGQLPFRHDDDNQLAFAISGSAKLDLSLVNPKKIAETASLPVRNKSSSDPDPVVYRPWRYRGLGGAISSLAVNQTNENRPIVFLSQKTDGDKPDKNRIIYIPLPMYEKTYEIFASADGNGLWDLSPCAVSFGNNTKLLIRAEQNGRMMLYHLQLRECDRLRPEALRLVDPWGFGSITHAAPVRSDPAIITPPPERFGSGTHATTVRADERILIAHSCAGEPPAWYIFDLAAPTEPPEIVSANECNFAPRFSNSSKAPIPSHIIRKNTTKMSLTSRDPFQLSGRYADRNRWEVLNGPGDSRVTGEQIIKDEGLVNAWEDKVVLITGVSSGIGVETVRVMALTGATVYGTARNIEKAKEALGSVLDTGRVHLLYMDQTDLASVRACADTFRKQSNKLNVMINNAAVMNTPEGRTKDGFELQFGTNHLSHFLLFWCLKDLLLQSSTPSFHSRVVNVSSAAHRYGPVQLDNINFEGNYNGWLAYGSSKTANIYMTTQIERLYGSQGLHGYSVHPGAFVSPNLQKHSQAEMEAIRNDDRVCKYMCSTAQACATSIYSAISSDLEGRGGLYLEGASLSVHPCPPDGDAVEYGYASWAFDKEKEERLWELSKQWAKVNDP